MWAKSILAQYLLWLKISIILLFTILSGEENIWEHEGLFCWIKFIIDQSMVCHHGGKFNKNVKSHGYAWYPHLGQGGRPLAGTLKNIMFEFNTNFAQFCSLDSEMYVYFSFRMRTEYLPICMVDVTGNSRGLWKEYV